MSRKEIFTKRKREINMTVKIYGDIFMQ